MTTIPPITTIPSDPPSTSDPTNFDTRADAFLGDFPAFGAQLNTTITAMNTVAGEVEGFAADAEAAQAAAEGAEASALGANTRVATSASSHSFTAGSKTFAMVESARTFVAQMEIVVYRASDVSARMYGSVDLGGISGQNLTASFTSEGIVGAGGPYTDWVIADAGFFQTGATAAEARAMTSPFVALTPDAVADALAEVTLTDAATIAVDMSSGFNFAVTLGGNRTLGNPTATTNGKTGRIRIVQDGTGSRTLAYGTSWEFESGIAPALSTTAGAVDFLDYEVVSSTSIRARLTKAWA